MRKPTVGIDYTNRDYEAYRQMMIDNLLEKFPNYDTSQTDAGITMIEGMAKAADIISMYNEIVANDSILETTQDRSLAVIISRMLGHFPANATAAVVKQIFVLSREMEEEKVIPKGTVLYTPKSSDSESIYFETLDDLVIPAGSMGDETDEDGNYLYTVDAAQGKSVTEDVLGSSDGKTKYQSFTCGYQNVIVDSLEVYVNEGNGYVLWERVETFIDSDADSRHYTVSVDEFDRCTVSFGNGTLGKIPMEFDNGILADYRVGGGRIGNVKANTITEIQSGISFIDYTTNPDEPYSLGAEKEALDEIKELAPKAFKTRDRAIATGDFADLIRLNFNKYFRYLTDITTEGSLVVDTYYLIRDGYEMTDDLEAEIQEYLSTRKALGSIIVLHPHVEKVVNINATLKIFKEYNREIITGIVESAVRSYFDKGEFDFGEEFILSDLESEIVDGIDGVRSFRINTPDLDIEAQGNEIIVLGELELEVSGGK